MGFFEQTRWSCGFWRWGNFRQQCHKEYRTGETCGLKLIFVTNQDPNRCKLCRDVEKQQRKSKKLSENIRQWGSMAYRTTSIKKAEEELEITRDKIAGMLEQHKRRKRMWKVGK
ncbi:hypothetical protein F4821DRAFT_250687 [Hypoxylon rubiginosum]|uniref:Uncharacterized protein n=1 Tax=Hypoxylon rubiginosum TaxID=110542 RepID=A0ACC0CK32_9PEZI|nr:hypothetical protein F4821DRAFT_250687 [Hypoxylon rubiginosum]